MVFSGVFGLGFVWHRRFGLVCDVFPDLGLGFGLLGSYLLDFDLWLV